MTAQIGDKLVYEGKVYIMASEPSLSGKDLDKYEIRIITGSTACWRGYDAEWEIVDNKLFLKEVSGTVEVVDLVKYREEKLRLRKLLKQGIITPQENGKMLRDIKKELAEEKELDLQFLFGSKTPVFAKWFSGIIRVPMGEILEYIHMGYCSLYEEDMYLYFIHGILTDKMIKNNRPAKQ
jgi:hypothetical protein